MTTRTSNNAFVTVLPARSLTGIGWEARVISPTDWSTPLAYVARFSELKMQRVRNDIGAGSITLDADDPVLHDPLPLGLGGSILDYECLWQFYEDGVLRFEWLGEDTQEDVVAVADGPRATIVSGRSIDKVLEWGVAVPGLVTQPVLNTRDPGPSYDVTEKSLTDFVATLTIGTHAIKVDDVVVVDHVDTVFNGQVTITAVTDTTVSFDRFQPDVSPTAATGTVTGPHPYIDKQVRDPMSFTGKPAVKPLLWLIDQVQGRGTLPFLKLTFDATQDSQGNPWADQSDVVISPGESILALLQRLSRDLGWEFRVLPGWKLYIGQAGIGAHREEAVKVFVGGQQISHARMGSTRDVMTDAYVMAPDKSVAHSTETSAASPWKRERWLEAGGASGISGAQRVANASVALYSQKKFGRTVKVLPDSPTRRLFDDFDVCDWISVEDERYRTFGVRVSAATLTVDQDTQTDLELTIDTKFDAAEVQVKRVLDTLGASVNVDTATPITTTVHVDSVKLSDLADVVGASGAEEGDMLRWSGSAWEVFDPDFDTARSLDWLTDVDTSTTPPTDGQALLYDKTAKLWKPGTVSGGGSSSLTAAGGGVWIDDSDPSQPVVHGVATGAIFSSPTTVSGSAYAYKGVRFSVLADSRVVGIRAILSVIAAGVYSATLVRMSGTTVAEVVATSANVEPGAAASTTSLIFLFSNAVTVEAGKTYATVVGRTDGSGTYALPIANPGDNDTIVPEFAGTFATPVRFDAEPQAGATSADSGGAFAAIPLVVL